MTAQAVFLKTAYLYFVFCVLAYLWLSIRSKSELSLSLYHVLISLAAFHTDTKEGRRSKARMLRLVNCPALAWATEVLGVSTSRLSNNRFIIAGRHTLGLGVLLQVETQPCLCGVGNTGRLDHAMACNKTKGKATSSHFVSIGFVVLLQF